ncbi:MAG TPA: hypothetical protein ENJ45_04090, partial [Phaeodactylibacter sp.]|nr:hypothetical protein [Phaeodactylibacter sp.]
MQWSLRKATALSLVFSLFSFTTCNKAPTNSSKPFVLRVRLAADPGKLNPLLSTNGYAEQVLGNIFMSLEDFDPEDYSLRSTLLSQAPTHEIIKHGPFKGGLVYHFHIREEASWDNGQPVLASDFLFSIKAMMNPEGATAPYRSFFDFIGELTIDEKNPKQFSILCKKPYLLAEAMISTLSVYPEYVYDPEGLLRSFTLQDLIKDSLSESQRELLQNFGDNFQSEKHCSAPEGIVGCGPYRLSDWQSGQYIILKKKNEWWANQLMKTELALAAYPDEIHYKIIPDNAAAISALKNEQLDLMSEIEPLSFVALQQNDFAKEHFDFYTPPTLSYYYIAMNSKKATLEEVTVRRALAHLCDVEQMIQSAMHGLAARIVGPIHPSKPFYNSNLSPISFDIQKAKMLLAKAGWIDTDGDGLLDKVIRGKKEKLSLRFLYSSGNKTAEAVAAILRQAALQAGIEIIPEGMPFGEAVKAYRSRAYDLAYFRWSKMPGPQDMKQLWHTDSDTYTGGNRT